MKKLWAIKITRDLTLGYVVYSFLNIISPHADLRSIENLTTKTFLAINFKNFLKFVAPGYFAAQLYYIYYFRKQMKNEQQPEEDNKDQKQTSRNQSEIISNGGYDD